MPAELTPVYVRGYSVVVPSPWGSQAGNKWAVWGRHGLVLRPTLNLVIDSSAVMHTLRVRVGTRLHARW